MSPTRPAAHAHAPLVRVLEHRRDQEDAQRRVLGQLHRERADAQAALVALIARAETERTALATPSGVFDTTARVSALGYIDRLDAAVAFQHEVIATYDERIEVERATLLERRRETQLLERLLERRAAEAALEAARVEARQADEQATNRYVRQIRGGA